MTGIDRALTESRRAAEQLLADAESLGPGWATPRAAGKWSASQIVEHVARTFDAAVALAHGQPSAFPRLPAFVHPLGRLLFNRIVKTAWFPKGRTTRGMNPAAGPATPAEGRGRLVDAHARFEAACRQLASQGAPVRTPMFGRVPVEAFVRFLELHTRHHGAQIPRVSVPGG